MPTTQQPTEGAQGISARFFWILFLLIALVGGAGRVADSAARRSTGFDEILYRRYVNMMDGGEQIAPVFQLGSRGAHPYEVVIEGRGGGGDAGDGAIFPRDAEAGDCEV